MTNTAGPLSFYFDYVSPYSYLASTQVEALAARAGVELRWRPVLLGAVMKSTGNQPPGTLPARARYMFEDLRRWSVRYGIPYRFPSAFPFQTLPALRATLALLDASPGDAAFVHAVFRAAWAEDRDVSDPSVLLGLALEAGLDPSPLAGAATDPRWKDALRASTDEALALGAFGVPCLAYEGEIYFGNDRLGLLEDRLARGRPW
ncbi:2-hydroxychromene-2-carboxylate isomerase [Myxococcota bacterium]|nr:2-hydroxychromene-2-carboxylate isomerase [Myxococcota bacterium]